MFFGLEFTKAIVILEITTLKLVNNESLTHTVNFGIGSAFSSLALVPGTLYKVKDSFLLMTENVQPDFTILHSTAMYRFYEGWSQRVIELLQEFTWDIFHLHCEPISMIIVNNINTAFKLNMFFVVLNFHYLLWSHWLNFFISSFAWLTTLFFFRCITVVIMVAHHIHIKLIWKQILAAEEQEYLNQKNFIFVIGI